MRIYESMGVGVCFDLCWRKKKENRKIDLGLEKEEESRKNRRMSKKEERRKQELEFHVDFISTLALPLLRTQVSRNSSL